MTSRAKWHAWLASHHQSADEVWLVFYKKHTGRARLAYADAIEEALCFGWVDNIVKRINEASFALKFTPRRDGSRWSEVNKQRFRKLLREGRVTEAGLAKAPSATRKAPVEGIPTAVRTALKGHPKAWNAFQKLSPFRRKVYVQMMTEPKKEETRTQRVREVIHQLEQNTGEVTDLPGFLEKALKANGKAWENFQNLAPSYRRHYVGWIMHAKQEETRQRRLREAVALLEQNKKLGLK